MKKKSSSKKSTITGAAQQSPRLNDWYKKSYRRFLIDMHIPDWDKQFLSKLDADTFINTMAKGNSTGFMLYCNSHVGPTLYPSKIGTVHKNVGKNDFVGAALKAARKKKLAVTAYYTVIFDNTAFMKHPEWRIIPIQGESIYETSRYGGCCPNSPYRDFAAEQAEEICSRYEFDGIFFDMLFWPFACYCPHCRARFKKEAGAELPEIIDWNNPTWMAFQRARERWMDEFAGMLTAAVKQAKPEMTATHQMSPVLAGWLAAMPFSLTDHCDYTSGDFYGSPQKQSFVCKVFAALSQKTPFEFMTSRCIHLRDHVTLKSASEMEMQAFLAPAFSAAFMFIDAIDPVGTLNPRVYERIGGIFPKLEPYEKFLGGRLSADVAVYYSSESRFDFRENGIPVAKILERADNMAAERDRLPHLVAAEGASQALQEAHIPYDVVTQKNLNRLKDYKVAILPNVLVMTEEEAEAFRAYVAGGGALYASGYSSLIAADGTLLKDFALADVFGVSANAMMTHELAYVTPTEKRFARTVLPQDHLIQRGGWITIKSRTASVIAGITKTWYPDDKCTVLRPSFASIHSSPPAPESFAPAITIHKFGKGTACYAAAPIEAEHQEVNLPIFAELIRRLHGGTIPVEADAPSFVEVTVFDKASENRLNISLVSLRQNEEPIPCGGKVRVRLGKQRGIVAVRSLPMRRKHPFKKISGGIEFAFKDFTTFAMFELEYKDL